MKIRQAKLEREGVAHQYCNPSHHFQRNCELWPCNGFAQRIAEVEDIELAGAVRVARFGICVFFTEQFCNLKSDCERRRTTKTRTSVQR
jgi:hypothetical protein